MHHQAFADHTGLQALVAHREGDFHATEEVALHPVRAREHDVLVAVRIEVIDAMVFEKAPHDRAHGDVLGQALHPGAQRAHAAYDQIDLHAGARGLVQLGNDRRLKQCVHFRDDARFPARRRRFRFAANRFEQVRVHRERRLPEAVQMRLASDARELLEDDVHVGAQRFVRRHQAEVRVQTCGARVIVAGAEVDVALEERLLALTRATHHEQHLRVALVADHAIDHVRAHGFEARGPVDVRFFVEAREQLHHDRDFLAVAGGFHQGVHQRRLVAGAVDRLLDGHDIGVARRLQQQFEHGLEAVVRVMQQQVALIDEIEHRGRSRHAFGQRGHERHELQVRTVDHLGQRHQAHEVHGALHAVAVRVAQPAFRLQASHEASGRAGVDFQTHGVAEVTRREFALQGGAQVGDFVFVDEQIAVTRDAELVAALGREPREQLARKAQHKRAEQHEAVGQRRERGGHRHETGQGARGLHDGELGVAAEGVLAFELDGEVQALVEHAGERVRGVQPDGREHRHEFAHEVVAGPFDLSVVPLSGGVKRDAFGLQLRQDAVEHGVLLLDKRLCPGADLRVNLLKSHAVGREHARILAHLLLQSGDADLEEFIQIATHDTDETQAFQQWRGRIGRLGKYAFIERKNAQLAVEQRVIHIERAKDMGLA